MFIKIFPPNENGKIELTIKELEALIQEAVEKANVDKCSKCTRGWSWSWNDYNRVTTTPNITLLNDKANSPSRNGEITWNNKTISYDCATNEVGDLSKFRSLINEQLEFDFNNIKEN